MKFDKDLYSDDCVLIFFDTNTLECRHSNKELFLSKLKLSSLYYEVEHLIRDLGLTKDIMVCIPEIVWLELKNHMIENFKATKDSMLRKIESYRKSFGDLVELNCSFKHVTKVEDYTQYVTNILNEFWTESSRLAQFVPYPKNEASIVAIVNKAISTVKPFKKAKVNGKEYSDVGFKDALIFHTMQQYCDKHLCVLISNDNDFQNIFDENNYCNFKLCRDVSSLKKIIFERFNVVPKDEFYSFIKSNDYLMSRILTETGFNNNIQYKFINVLSVTSKNEGIDSKIVVEIEEEKYIFEILYNMESRELLSVSYDIYDEADIYGNN